MSATNRGSKRVPADFYPTPGWAVERLIEAVPWVGLMPNWIEPGAGDGAIIRAVGVAGIAPVWCAIENRVECVAPLCSAANNIEVFSQDFLTMPFVRRFNVAIMNPPYSKAAEFVAKAREIADHTFALLRLNFLGTEKRADMLRVDMPNVYVLPQRPSFTGGGTDATEYAWMHWAPGRQQRGSVAVLKSTSRKGRA